MPFNGVRTKPEHHTLYYVEDETGMIFLTHFMKPEYRLIENWYHEDFVKAHCGEMEIEDFETHTFGGRLDV